MKILCLCSGAYFYGKESVTVNVVKGLKKHGHTTKIIFSGWHDGVFKKKLTEIGVEAHALKLGWYYLKKPLWSLDSLIHFPKALYQFLKILKSFKPDVIYTDSYRQLFLLMPFIKREVIYHVNDPHTESRTDRKMLQLIKHKVTKYIAASAYIKRDLIEAGVPDNKINIAYNGSDVPAEKDKIYLPNGVIRIGIVGQIIERKGHEDLINALKLLKQHLPFTLYIYGSGNKEYTEHIKNIIEEFGLSNEIQWMGFENNRDKIYDNLDVLVAPTRNNEPFGLIAAEASLYKVIPIVTKSGGLPEIVLNGKSGFIVNRSSPEEIAEKIKFLFFNQIVFEEMGKSARRNVIENFTSEQMHTKIDQVLSSVINN